MWLSLFVFLKAFVSKMKHERQARAVGAAMYSLPLPYCVALGKSCNYTGTLFPSPETRTINIPPLTLVFCYT